MIKTIADFPKPGIRFLDITSFLLDSKAVNNAVDAFASEISRINPDIDQILIVGPEARGFIFGSMVAYHMKQPFFMLRKAGKLPDDGTQVSFRAEKEYGSSEFVVNLADLEALKEAGCTKVVILDDILATGFTDCAIARFFVKHGFEVLTIMNLIEIVPLHGSKVFADAGFNSYSYLLHEE